MTAPVHPSGRSMITADAMAAGWRIAQDNDRCSQYVHSSLTVLTVLWTSDGELFAATLAGDGRNVPSRLGVLPVGGDTAAAESVLIGWLKGRGYKRPEVRDLGIAGDSGGTVTELSMALRNSR